jgi:anti-anti-sigma regulatory factor
VDIDYRILEVSWREDRVVAVLPLARVLGNEMSQALREDYCRLAESSAKSVELDLRAVEFIDGTFFSRLLELRKALVQKSVSLQLRVSAKLMETMVITRLDKVLETLSK